MRTNILLISLLALVGALGCTKGETKPQPKSGPTSIQRAEKPGIIPIEDALKGTTFNNLSTVYLLAAAKGSPFSTQYERLNEISRQGMPKDLQQAFEALVKHVRTGGDAAADIQQHTDVLKKHPVGTTLLTVPSTTTAIQDSISFTSINLPIFNFIYLVNDRKPKGPKLSLQTLFKERNLSSKSPPEEVPVPLEASLGFQEPPQNITLELDNMILHKDVTVSPKLTLPAACTAQGQDTAYKLTGVFRLPGEYYKKEDFLRYKFSRMGEVEGVEGLTYFRWGNQWYKITASAPMPATTIAQEAQEIAEKSDYISSSFRYLYTRDDAA